MSKTNILVFKAGDEETYIQAGSNKEVCRLTKGLETSLSQMVHAYTEVKGGTFIENRNLLCNSGYESFKKEEDLDKMPAPCPYMENSWISTLIVSTKIEDDLLKLKHEQLLTEI